RAADARARAGRLPRRYGSIEEAFARMQAENSHLTPEQARYLTVHGASQNEDGTYSWKFDNYIRSFSPADFTPEEQQQLWANIDCPVLLVNAKESWAPPPQPHGRAAHSKDVRVVEFENAGHWVHRDRLEAFLAEVRGFL